MLAVARQIRRYAGGTMRRRACLLILFLAGCSSAQNQPAGSGGASGSGGSGTADGPAGSGGDGVTDGGCPAPPDVIVPPPRCNSIANNAQAVPFTMRNGTPPTPAGGTIRDGVYAATAAEGYGAVTPAGRRLTLAVTGNATQMLWTGDVLDATGATVTLSFTANTHIATAGNQVSFTVDCASSSPSPIPASLTYTASGDQLIMSRATGADVAVTTYTRMGCLTAP
jgi:hypothetical protein